MGRTVADVAAVLTVIAGTDAADAATAEADARRPDYVAALDANALAGKRIGVLRFQAGFSPAVDAQFRAGDRAPARSRRRDRRDRRGAAGLERARRRRTRHPADRAARPI